MEERYIVDRYNALQKNDNVIETFRIQMGGFYVPYCIRKVLVKQYIWGVPLLEDWEEQDWETDYSSQCSYDSVEAARAYIREIKRGK